MQAILLFVFTSYRVARFNVARTGNVSPFRRLMASNQVAPLPPAAAEVPTPPPVEVHTGSLRKQGSVSRLMRGNAANPKERRLSVAGGKNGALVDETPVDEEEKAAAANIRKYFEEQRRELKRRKDDKLGLESLIFDGLRQKKFIEGEVRSPLSWTRTIALSHTPAGLQVLFSAIARSQLPLGKSGRPVPPSSYCPSPYSYSTVSSRRGSSHSTSSPGWAVA